MSKRDSYSTDDVTRRSAIQTGIAGLSGAGLLSLGGYSRATGTTPMPAGADAEETKNMHLSLAAYSVRDLFENDEMDLFEFIDWCAEMGLPGTELTSYFFRNNITTRYLHDLKQHAFHQGVTVSGTAVGNNFCHPPGKERREQIEHVKTWIDYAREFFAPHIRIFGGRAPDDVDKDTAVEWATEATQEVVAYAKKRGIVLGLENHGNVFDTAERVLRLHDAVGPTPWLGINLDTGNFTQHGYREIAATASEAVNVQLKIHITDAEGKQQMADFGRIRDILVENNYKGWIALEYEADDPRNEIPQYVDELQQLF